MVECGIFDFLKFYFLSFLRHNRQGPIFHRLSGLFSSGFKRNIVFMLTSGSHKMLKIFIDIIDSSSFLDNKFFLALLFFSFFSRLDKFRPILYRFNGRILRLLKGRKSFCICVCVLRRRGT